MTKKQLKLKNKLERKLKITLSEDEVLQVQQAEIAQHNTNKYRWGRNIFFLAPIIICSGGLISYLWNEVGSIIAFSGMALAIVGLIMMKPRWKSICTQLRIKLPQSGKEDS